MIFQSFMVASCRITAWLSATAVPEAATLETQQF
jgi:hypothetical protein